MIAEPTTDAPDEVWYRVDEHPAVVARMISRDQVYAAARLGRCRALWLSRRSLRVHRDVLDDLAASGKPRT